MPNWKKVITSGSNAALNSLDITTSLTASGLIYPTTDGTAGQAITTDGLGNLSLSNVSATDTEATHLPVKNTSGNSINKGTPVYITGNVGNSERLEIAPADASDSAKMPAVGLLETTLDNNGEGYVVQGGYLRGLVTDTIDGTTGTSNDTIYVKSGGGLTLTKPTGETNLIQNIAKIARAHQSAGSVVVSSILRTNDIPNLPEGRLFVGTSGNTSLTSDVVYIDDTNDRVGIGTISPNAKLDVVGRAIVNVSSGTNSILQLKNDGGDAYANYYDESSGNAWSVGLDESDSGKFKFAHAIDGDSLTTGTKMVIGTNGYVGIGTTNPGQKLEVIGRTKITQSGDALRINSSDANGPYVTWQNNGNSIGFVGSGYHLWSSPNNIAQNLGIRAQTRLDLGIQASVHMTILSSGNLGIGTTSPSEKLEVDGNVQIGSSVDAKLYMVSTGGNGNNERFFIEGYADGGTYGGGFKLSTRNDSNIFNTAVTVNRNGNFGIGTTNPTSELHINDATGNSVIRFSGGAANNETYDIGQGIVAVSNGGFGFRNISEDKYVMVFQDNTGNVGIGTTNPGYTLDVNGTLHSSNITLADGIYHEGDTNTYVNFLSDTIQLATGGTVRTYINSLGNVGIGTTSPGAKLHVLGTSSENATTKAEMLSNSVFSVRPHSTNSGTLAIAQVDGGNSVGMQFTNGAGTSNWDMSLQPFGGNVGIGTASPNDILDVTDGNSKMVFGRASSDRPLLYFQHNAIPVDGDEIGLLDFRGYNDASQDTRYVILTSKAEDVTDGSEEGSLTFQTMKGGTATQALTMRSGNVGIGTTDPGTKLEVVGTIRSKGDNPTLELTSQAINGNNWKLVSDDIGHFNLYEGTNSRIRVLDGGNVGIGTTSPNQRLHVNDGGIRVEKNATGLGGFVSVGNATELVGNYSAYFFGNTASDNNYFKGGIAYETVASTYGRGDMHFLQNSTTSNGIASISDSVMTILNGGDVGIGTTTPNAKLDVDGIIKGVGSIRVNSNGTSNPYFGLYQDGIEKAYMQFVNNGTNLVIQSDDRISLQNGTSTSVYIKGSGEVGIGNTHPDRTLDIVKAGASFRLWNTSGASTLELRGTNGQIKFTGGNPIGTEFLMINRGTNFAFKESGTGQDYIYISTAGVSNGNVGIGSNFDQQNLPSSALEVAGGIKVANDNDVASADKVGTLRYRESIEDVSYSYVDMCMRTGASTYEWVNIVQNNW